MVVAIIRAVLRNIPCLFWNYVFYFIMREYQ